MNGEGVCYNIMVKSKIGVFDSGVGGRSTLATLENLLPEYEYLYRADNRHATYGGLAQDELLAATTAICRDLIAEGVRLIVIACNTATTRCIHELRRRFPEVTFVGMEPALKLACDHGAQKILLLATPNTAASRQVQRLVGARTA